MPGPKFYAVITTIAPPTECVRQLHKRLTCKGQLIVVGDTKGPAAYDLPGVTLLPYHAQAELGFELYEMLPTRHYARKNLGYLYAMRNGAECIYETDDDNMPMEHWAPRAEQLADLRTIDPETESGSQVRWVNVYRYFTEDRNIWPRGFPLNLLFDPVPEAVPCTKTVLAPIQQGLVNHAPDVDAIWRLTQDRPFNFESRTSVVLSPGMWCPFNTQSTWWWPKAYPLLYVPSHCSFRMCDIWKSFVAQRCLWALGLGVVFHAPEVIQDRNVHNLMKDFENEIPGFMGNQRLAGVLGGLVLPSGAAHVADNLIRCYEALNRADFFPKEELTLARAWVRDLEASIGGGSDV